MTTVVDTKLNDYKHDLTKTMTCIIPSVLLVVGVTCYDCYYVGVDILAGTEFLAEFDKVQAAFCGLGVVAVVCGLVLILSNCFCEPKATNRGRVQDPNLGRENQKKSQNTYLKITLAFGWIMVLFLLASVLMRITVLASHWTSKDKFDILQIDYPADLPFEAKEHYKQIVHLLWFLKPVICFVCTTCALIYMIIGMVFAHLNMAAVNKKDYYM